MSGFTRDHFSSFKSAGRTIAHGEDTTANCMKAQIIPKTPIEIKKYRKSYKQQHGVTIIHAGLCDIPKQANNFVYGKKTDISDKANDLLKNNKNAIQELMINIQESAYASHKREPLAVGPTRNYLWPSETTKNSFQFGLEGKKSEYSAKEIVFPPHAQNETEENRLQYLKSHGNSEAGEQKRRNYSWVLDPGQHRFGKVELKVENQMKNVLHQEITNNQYPTTKILKKTQSDFNNYTDDPVGRPKNLAQVNHYVNMNTLFGSFKKTQDWNAGQCIRGESSLQEARPDYDLGQASKSGWRNQPSLGDESRTFGLPTIRSDLTRKGLKSVADPQNYGDEVPAIALLFPQKFTHMGLSEKDFLMKRSREEIKSIFASIGYSYGLGKFQAIYQRAREIENTDEDQVSVNAFERAFLEMHHIE